MLVMHEALPDRCALPFLDKSETPSFSALLRLRELEIISNIKPCC
jgi:hypothetical protein